MFHRNAGSVTAKSCTWHPQGRRPSLDSAPEAWRKSAGYHNRFVPQSLAETGAPGGRSTPRTRPGLSTGKPLGNIGRRPNTPVLSQGGRIQSPAKLEAAYSGQQKASAEAAWLKQTSLRDIRDGSWPNNMALSATAPRVTNPHIIPIAKPGQIIDEPI